MFKKRILTLHSLNRSLVYTLASSSYLRAISEPCTSVVSLAYALPMLRYSYNIAMLSEHYSNDSPTLLERTAENVDGVVIEGDSQF